MSEKEQQSMIASGGLISICEAATHTPYSAEYLSLLARKGKLKAVKVSRDWLTTREAVFEYVKKQQVKHSKFLKELDSFQSGNFFKQNSRISVKEIV
jgi:hypothetical protein